jgi:hypothetical protein
MSQSSDTNAAALRDAYVKAFNAGNFKAIGELLSDEAAYRWVTAGRIERGREAVLKLYEMGHQAYQGKSRLTVVNGTDDQAIWWQPEQDEMKPAGLQTLSTAEGHITEINDEHTPVKVQAAVEHTTPPQD